MRIKFLSNLLEYWEQNYIDTLTETKLKAYRVAVSGICFRYKEFSATLTEFTLHFMNWNAYSAQTEVEESLGWQGNRKWLGCLRSPLSF